MPLMLLNGKKFDVVINCTGEMTDEEKMQELRGVNSIKNCP